MADREIVRAILDEMARLLVAAGLPYALKSLEKMAATATLPAGFRATFEGPPDRRLMARIFDNATTLSFSLQVHDVSIDRSTSVHALLSYLKAPVPFTDFKLESGMRHVDVAAGAQKLVGVLTTNPQLVGVLSGQAWIDVPFDWGDWK